MVLFDVIQVRKTDVICGGEFTYIQVVDWMDDELSDPNQRAPTLLYTRQDTSAESHARPEALSAGNGAAFLLQGCLRESGATLGSPRFLRPTLNFRLAGGAWFLWLVAQAVAG